MTARNVWAAFTFPPRRFGRGNLKTCPGQSSVPVLAENWAAFTLPPQQIWRGSLRHAQVYVNALVLDAVVRYQVLTVQQARGDPTMELAQ